MALTVGRLAEIAEVNIETIRYYERRGLLPEPKRNESGYRVYDSEALNQLHFILNAKRVGFSLREIGELLSLKVIPDTRCTDVRIRAEEKIKEIDRKIAELKRIRRALDRLTRACEGNAPVEECRIIRILSNSTI